MSEIRADRIYNEDGSSGPSFPNGIPNLVMSGITTVTTLTATTLRVGSGVTISAGIVSATEFRGSGASLTGVEVNGALRSTQNYTTAGSYTWTKPAGLKRVRVYVTGGGGGGGNTASNNESSGGGASGGTAIKIIEAASLGSTETVTVGSAGAAGNPAATGGTSSFGSHCSATGGKGGSSNMSYTGNGYLNPGVGSNGDLNIMGSAPDAGTPGLNVGGSGGPSFWGGAGYGGFNYSFSNGGLGAFGGGGGGGYRTTAGANASGAAGGAGVVVVEEYF